jgi:antibiotic biosynthesis monooxygenase (ABM) superfamily enzyme
MSTTLANVSNPDEGATVVITHRLRDHKQAEYESWLKEIGPLCSASPGFLDLHRVRPIPGLTGTYTVIIRFETEAYLREWSTDGY